MEKTKALIRAALQARAAAYCPYSHFAVGAALRTEEGEIFTGCNVETAAFNGSCAERTAVFKAVSQGYRRFAAIAVVGGAEGSPPEEFCPPCGVCRQVLAEFCSPELPVILAKSPEEWQLCTLGQLLPMAFGPGFLEGSGEGEG